MDAPTGLEYYHRLAKEGDLEGMTATGICLIEGLGTDFGREKEGLDWLIKAHSQGGAQACYELGILYYAGLPNVVTEDEATAFKYFESAAEAEHVAGMFMTADCLLDAVGCEQDIPRAISLLYAAAEKGHRFARQRMRELLDESR